jgi:DNA-binding MarR family transcriptional regulator
MSMVERDDLHWLALQLFRRLGTLELPAVGAHGLSLWGYEVLTEVVGGPARSQAEIGVALALDKTKIMRIVDELEESGHLRREPAADDRRRRTLTITAAGRAAWSATRAALAAIEADLYARLPADLRAPTAAGLRHLVAAMPAPTGRPPAASAGAADRP